mgnify:CR=1 FL=1
MNGFLANLVAGALANLISDGIETSAKYVLSTRQVDMELRRSIDLLEKRQLNAEGAIERLVNNQELLISLFASIIAENQLKSQVYIENQNIIIITDPNDIRWLKSIDTEKNRSIDASEVVVESNVFEEYHNYVKKMRRND